MNVGSQDSDSSATGNLANAAAAATVVPIFGMHRSGTSMLTRALNLAGLQLGQPLQEPLPDNPLGYWENSFFVRTNGELLKTLHCDVNGFAAREQLMKLPERCRKVIVDDQKLAEIRDFLAATFSSSSLGAMSPGAPVWGWKDPRTVLTWNVWQRLLERLGYADVRPVIFVRHPATAVRSLVRRVQRMPSADLPQHRLTEHRLTEMATDIWRGYNQILLESCTGRNWFVGLYERFVNPATRDAELRRLLAYCGLAETGLTLASDSIVLQDGDREEEPFGNSQAMAVYGQLFRLAESQARDGKTRPCDTRVQAEPDEARLIRRALEFKQNGRIDGAVELLRKGLQIRPHYRAARFLLGHTLMETGHITRATEQARILIQADAHDPIGHGLIAFGLTQQASISAAMEAFRECIRCLPNNSVAWSNMMFASLYGDHNDAATVTCLHQEAGRAIASLAAAEAANHSAFSRSAPRERSEVHSHEFDDRTSHSHVWRIGYLSGDLKKHPVGYFLRSILAHHDCTQFEITCYDIGAGDDELTTLLKQRSQHWCNARSMTDQQLLKQIRDDQIDILIDLCGHSSGNRAGVITQRAAPVQATYLGYPCTSGLPNMDFIISDHHLSPPEFEPLYTERVQRLDGCFLCFHPHDEAPEVAPTPHQINGFVTFGSSNNLPKISPTTVKLWSDILKAVPDSRLVLKALSFVDTGTQDLFHDHFATHGIQRSRVDLLPPTVPLAKFLDEYRRIDIALDPLPYNGGTTTCEALWMGVPVITLPGQHFFGRMGLSILRTLRLEDCIATSATDYVRIAAELAGQPERLTQYRSTLRARVQNSALCDGQHFTRGLESAYKAMLNAGEPLIPTALGCQ